MAGVEARCVGWANLMKPGNDGGLAQTRNTRSAFILALHGGKDWLYASPTARPKIWG